MIVIITLLFTLTLTHASPIPKRYCAGYLGPGSHTLPDDSDDTDYSEYSNDDNLLDVGNNRSQLPGTVLCPANMQRCYSVWTLNENGTINIVRQGCWESETCINNECINEPPIFNQQTPHKFCCCNGDMCNKNFSSVESSPILTARKQQPFNNWLILNSPAIWICSTITAISIFSLIMLMVCRFSPKSEPELAPLAPSGPGYSSNLQNVDNLKLCAMIGQGKYGTVWKGMINEQPVAVKIFPGQYKQYFLNERDIYTTNLMESPSLLAYYGCDQRRTMDDNIEYLLVLSLAPQGCLQDWLAENTGSFQVFAKMAKSIAHGVSHLHSQIIKGDVVKPCICHRDLNSRNVLVKPDLSCCICDFGFALKTFGPRYEYKGEMTLAETKSINEVGTLRYMAPEILEGAVNLRDCETALKQIDVYAIGLLLWELCVRCHDFYPAGESPTAYQAPYEAETGKNPTFEQMQVLVSRHKARPLFPATWGGCAASKLAKDTCEDCWDHDAEARLTAFCVEERIHEISTYRPKHTVDSSNTSSLNTSNNLISASTQSVESVSPPKNNNILIFTPNSINLITAPPNQIIPQFNGGEHTGDTLISVLSPIITTPHLQHNDLNHKTNANIIINSIDQHTNGSGSPHAVSSHTKNDKKRKGWHGVRMMIKKKFFKPANQRCGTLTNPIDILSDEDPSSDRSNLVDCSQAQHHLSNTTPTRKVKNINCEPTVSAQQQPPEAKMHQSNTQSRSPPLRPNNLDIQKSHNKILNNDISDNDSNSDISRIKPIINSSSNNTNLKYSPATGQTFTVIKSNHTRSKSYSSNPNSNNNSSSGSTSNYNPKIVVSKSANAVKQLNNTTNEKYIKRQRSLEIFREVFHNSKGSCERLRDPSQRVKTPGDVPPSVRKIRASKTLSLYDDRMMDTSYEYGCGFYGSTNGGNTL